MERKNFKITQSKFGVLLYPTPVNKETMYLIKAPSALHAEIYKYLLDFTALQSPLESPAQYIKLGIHSDGVTPVFELNWEQMRLILLPNRQADLDRALILETLLSKKFEKLFTNIESRTQIIKDIQFRFSQQLLCSECQKLGISNPELVQLFEGLNQWL